MKRVIFASLFLSLICSSAVAEDHKEHQENRSNYIPLITDMYFSVPYRTYGPNPNFKDQKSLQDPAQGTVPRGFTPYTLKKEDVAKSEGLQNPFQATAKNLARGQKVYESKCLICHGTQGKADGPIIGKYPRPTSYEDIATFSAGRIYHVITVGKGIMGAYGSMITPDDRWKLVLYVQKLINDLK